MSAQVSLSSSIYSPECLQDAVIAYQGLCSVQVFNKAVSDYYIEITGLAGIDDEQQLINEFLNYLLDLSLEKHLATFQEAYGTDRISTA